MAKGIVCQTSPSDRFLRSVNVELDAERPDRIAHFFPTKKSAVLLNALLGFESDRCFLVVAPYGSGKSLTAAYGLHLIENRRDSFMSLKRIEEKLRRVSVDLADFSSRRRENQQQGLVITLTGYQPDLALAFYEAALGSMTRLKLGREKRPLAARRKSLGSDIKATLKLLEAKVEGAGFDRILIVWDEFGRHLESIVSNGQARDLNEIQQLAEIASRAEKIPITFAVLLHQTILHYSNGLPQSVRTEWKKVEGRFRLLQFVDDSFEISKLIAQQVSEQGPRPTITRKDIQRLADQISGFGWFSDCNSKELADILHQAHPLDPATLYLLPRVSARVAQNERTLFTFIHEADTRASVPASALYDFFSSEMQSDVSAGGTHRRWIETESALSKVAGSEIEERVLKTACLLGLGLGGERSAASKEELCLAVTGFERSQKPFLQAIENLIERNLLLFRRNSNQVTVWHGTDLDLRTRLTEEKARLRQTFELFKFLDSEAPPPVWRPVEHNSKFGVRRYFCGKYLGLAELKAYLTLDLEPRGGVAPGVDGEILYLIPRNLQEIDDAREFLAQGKELDRVIVAVPVEVEDVTEAALEVFALQAMQQDPELAQRDPLAVTELSQLIDDARSHLRRLIDRHTIPARVGAEWWLNGRANAIDGVKALRSFLSRLCDREFNKTLQIHSEAMVRHSPSRVMVNARKKLELAVLERAGQERLGIEGNFPDASMFQTVLLYTGLYRASGDGIWGFAQPEEVSDPGLSEVWSKFKSLLTEPSSEPKPLRVLFEDLQSPPYGCRRGLFPVLFAAALRAFPAARSLVHRGEYIRDILPTVIEELCRNPDEFELIVLELSREDQDYLWNLYRRLTRGEPTATEDLIRQCYDALQAWRLTLPESALKTRRVSQDANRFRRLIARVDDPVDLFLERLPQDLGKERTPGSQTLGTIGQVIEELTSFSRQHFEYAQEQLRRAIALDPSDQETPMDELCRQWLDLLPEDILGRLRGPFEKGFITRIKHRYDTPDLFLESVASHLTEMSISRWDDAAAARFSREVRTVVQLIEEHAFSGPGQETQTKLNLLRQLYTRRLGAFLAEARVRLGPQDARRLLLDATTSMDGEEK